jgi:N-methylhydantoinase B/oxoprolinase/acetone carboxylase alpha subunit
MAAGVIDRLWSMGDLYDAVTEPAAQVAAKRKRDRRIQRLIDRLGAASVRAGHEFQSDKATIE